MEHKLEWLEPESPLPTGHSVNSCNLSPGETEIGGFLALGDQPSSQTGRLQEVQ